MAKHFGEYRAYIKRYNTAWMYLYDLIPTSITHNLQGSTASLLKIKSDLFTQQFFYRNLDANIQVTDIQIGDFLIIVSIDSLNRSVLEFVGRIDSYVENNSAYNEDIEQFLYKNKFKTPNYKGASVSARSFEHDLYEIYNTASVVAESYFKYSEDIKRNYRVRDVIPYNLPWGDTILGNKNHDEDQDIYEFAAFREDLSEDAQYTRLDILKQIINNEPYSHWGSQFNFRLNLDLEEEPGYINEDLQNVLNNPELNKSFDFTSLSVGQALDSVLKSDLNFAWKFNFSKSFLSDEFFNSTAEEGYIDLYLTILPPIPTEEVTDIEFNERLMETPTYTYLPVYRSVEVIGNKYIYGGTFSHQSDSLKSIWSQAKQDLFIQDDPRFVVLDDDNNKRIRNNPEYDLVFSGYTLGTGIFTEAIEGDVENSFIGVIYCGDEDNNRQILNMTLNGFGIPTPICPTACRITASIPWIKGYVPSADDSLNGYADKRDDKLISEPLSMQIFRKDGDTWHDLIDKPDEWNKITAQTSEYLDFKVYYEGHKEILAQSEWAEYDAPASTSHNPLSEDTLEAGSWKDLFVTAGVELTHRVNHKKVQLGFSYLEADDPINVVRAVLGKDLVIYRPLDFWVMRKGSIIGLDDNGPIRTYQDTIIKDDRKVAEDLANFYADLLLNRQSVLVSAKLAGNIVPEWMRVGIPVRYSIVKNYTKMPEVENGEYFISEEDPAWVDTTASYPSSNIRSEIAEDEEEEEEAVTSYNTIISSYTIDLLNTSITFNTQAIDIDALANSVVGPLGTSLVNQSVKNKSEINSTVKLNNFRTSGKVSEHEPPVSRTDLGIYAILGYNRPTLFDDASYSAINFREKLEEPNLKDLAKASAQAQKSNNADLIPDGIGIGLNITTGRYAYIANFKGESFINTDIIAGSRVKCAISRTLIGAAYEDEEGISVTPTITYLVPQSLV